MTQAYPLAWPAGWRRVDKYNRKHGQFGKAEHKTNAGGHSWQTKRPLSIADAVRRVREELTRFGVDVANDMVVSTNLKLNMSGMPRADHGAPDDPGAAVYWQKPGQPMRVMAIDTYDRVADNLGGIAATLSAMRAIERYGGAVILDRAFAGFDALPAPKSCWDLLGIAPRSSERTIREAWRKLVVAAHPDRGGSEARTAELNAARDKALQEIGA